MIASLTICAFARAVTVAGVAVDAAGVADAISTADPAEIIRGRLLPDAAENLMTIADQEISTHTSRQHLIDTTSGLDLARLRILHVLPTMLKLGDNVESGRDPTVDPSVLKGDTHAETIRLHQGAALHQLIATGASKRLPADRHLQRHDVTVASGLLSADHRLPQERGSGAIVLAQGSVVDALHPHLLISKNLALMIERSATDSLLVEALVRTVAAAAVPAVTATDEPRSVDTNHEESVKEARRQRNVRDKLRTARARRQRLLKR